MVACDRCEAGWRSGGGHVLACEGYPDSAAESREGDCQVAACACSCCIVEGVAERYTVRDVTERDGEGFGRGFVAVDADDCRLVARFHRVSHCAVGIVGEEEAHLAVAKNGVGVTDLAERCVVLAQNCVATGSVTNPWEGAAIIGVVGARHADFVAIVDGWGA